MLNLRVSSKKSSSWEMQITKVEWEEDSKMVVQPVQKKINPMVHKE